jgi:hypothetical protein
MRKLALLWGILLFSINIFAYEDCSQSKSEYDSIVNQLYLKPYCDSYTLQNLQNQLGSITAMNARAGLLGSGFGDAATADVDNKIAACELYINLSSQKDSTYSSYSACLNRKIAQIEQASALFTKGYDSYIA